MLSQNVLVSEGPSLVSVDEGGLEDAPFALSVYA